MLGHFLLTITPAEEDRILTHQLGTVMESRCLLQTMSGTHCALSGTRHLAEAMHAHGAECRNFVLWGRQPHNLWQHHVGVRYDTLIDRFGVKRVGQAIRTRILANKARRLLRQIETVTRV